MVYQKRQNLYFIKKYLKLLRVIVKDFMSVFLDAMLPIFAMKAK